MPRKGKKRKAPEPVSGEEQVGPTNRKSSRVMKPSLKVREVQSPIHGIASEIDEIEDISEQRNDFNEDRVQHLSIQLQEANEKIEELHHQLIQRPSVSNVQYSPPLGNIQSNLNTTQRLQNKIQPNSSHESEPQEVITAALQQLINPQEDDNNEGEQIYSSSYLILGSVVDRKLKEKIWSREYIDLPQLINKEDTDVAVSIHNGGRPSFSIRQNKSSPPGNIFQWLEMFSTFASIYLEKFPMEGPSLFTYMSKIIDLSRKHQGYLWRTYDEKFRRVKKRANFEWHEMRWELIMDSTFPFFKPQQQQPFRDNNNRRFQNERKQTNFDDNIRTPTGFCFGFDKTGRCQNPKQPCKFRHACSICKKGGHWRQNCYQNKQSTGKGPENQPSNNKSTK